MAAPGRGRARATTPSPAAAARTRRSPTAPPQPPAQAVDRKGQVAAGPDATPGSRRTRPGGSPPASAAPDRADQLAAIARASLEDDKAEDIVVLDVADRASFTDRMVIATGLVERQIEAMATHLVDALEEKGGLSLSRDRIQSSPDWVLIDAGDVVIHLFRPEARVTYGLERMWGPGSPHGEDAPPSADHAPLPEGAPTGEPLAEDEIGEDDDLILDDEDGTAGGEEDLLLGDDEDGTAGGEEDLLLGDDEDDAEEEDHGPT